MGMQESASHCEKTEPNFSTSNCKSNSVMATLRKPPRAVSNSADSDISLNIPPPHVVPTPFSKNVTLRLQIKATCGEESDYSSQMSFTLIRIVQTDHYIILLHGCQPWHINGKELGSLLFSRSWRKGEIRKISLRLTEVFLNSKFVIFTNSGACTSNHQAAYFKSIKFVVSILPQFY